MDYTFTIQDLVKYLSKSKQSIYNLFEKNKAFVKENSIRKGKRIYYNQAVLDLLNDYYTNGFPIDAPNKPIEAPSVEDRENITQEEIDTLHAKIKDLEAQLDAKNKQIEDLIKQNGLTLLLLQEEKQEKALLLPSPKQTLGEKIKTFFKK